MRKQKQCIQCKWRWIPRVKRPAQCPKCKRYDWKPALAAFVRSGEPNQPLESPAGHVVGDPNNDTEV